ncbi:MAG: hypothetical protein ACYC1D_08450 [Acidimicrobiales bacterium]
MADLVIDGSELVVRLSRKEQCFGFRRSVRVLLSAVRRVHTPDNAWAELRGWRSTGTAIPGKIALGTRRHGRGYDFTAVYGQRPTVLVELNGAALGEIMVSTPDPAAAAHDLAAAAGIAPG